MSSLTIAVFVGILTVSSLAAGEPVPGANDSAALQNLSRANTVFAINLYHNVAKAPGNVFFSPLSLSSALAMTYAGARGDTAQQMARVLHFPEDQTSLHQAFDALTRDFNAKSQDYELCVANALWAEKDFAFLEPFVNTLKTHYGAGLNLVDFKTRAEDTRVEINRWVETQTRDKIKNLIAPGVLDAATRLVLTNAVYFKGFWLAQFKKDNTRDEPFHVTAANTVTASLMNITGTFGYLEGDGFQALDMPYVGETLSMMVFLPKAVDGLSSLERSLTPEKLLEWMKGLRAQKVVVTVPRFKMTWESRMEKAMAEMGMPLAFSDAADFSGMTGQRDLFVSAVVHKAFVDVNEEGTEAAAATGVVMALTSAAVSRPPVFRADHPFLFLIRDRRSDSILFMGRVANPAT